MLPNKLVMMFVVMLVVCIEAVPVPQDEKLDMTQVDSPSDVNDVFDPVEDETPLGDNSPDQNVESDQAPEDPNCVYACTFQCTLYHQGTCISYQRICKCIGHNE